MNVTYFKFDNEEQANKCLEALQSLDSSLTWDAIGTISVATEELDSEGNVVYVDLAGYHVNVITSVAIPEEYVLCCITKPSKPYRKFLGQE